MATKKTMETWIASASGRKMNPDNAYGLQCVDVVDDYAIALFGNWVNTIRPVNGAKEILDKANPDYFNIIHNNPNDPNQVPQRGDVIVWGTSKAVPEGHTAVVTLVKSDGVNAIQQDGYMQTAAHEAWLPYLLPNGAMVLGWLRPKWEAEVKLATVDEIKKAYLEILERPADEAGLTHYTKYTIDFVRADLLSSDERKYLEIYKAKEAEEKARIEQDAIEAKKKVEEDEKRRLEEEAKVAEEAEKTTDNIQEEVKEDPKEETMATIPTTEQLNEIRSNSQAVLDSNLFLPVIPDNVKTIAYFITDITATISALVFTLLAIFGVMDAIIAITVNAAITTALLGLKQTFRLSSKKQ